MFNNKSVLLSIILLNFTLGFCPQVLQAKEDNSPSPNEAAQKDGPENSQQVELEAQELSPLENLVQADNNNGGEVVLNGSATRVLNSKAKITVSLLTILSSEFSNNGDPVTAKILVKPNGKNDNPLEALKGSKIIGHVVDVKRSRKGGRAGYVKVVFDTLQIKSGKTFPIKAEMTTESFKGKEASKLVLYDAKLVTLGALWGTYNSLRWAPVAAFTTNGLSVAVSAGIGASMGIIGAIRRKGETKTFHGGEKSNIEFTEALSLSDEALQEAALASKALNADLIGLKIELLETQLVPSEDYDNILSVKVKVNNYTEGLVYPCDLLLVPKDGSNPVMADLRMSGNDLLKSVSQGQESTVTLLFPMSGATQLSDYNLALVDPLDKAFLSKLELNGK